MTKKYSASLLLYLYPLLPVALAGIALVFQTQIHKLLLYNMVAQIAWFVIAAHVPAARTAIMSYVDLAWPWGLCIIGLVALGFGEGDFILRVAVSIIYLAMGLRTGIRSVSALRRGAFRKEFSRYEYQKLRWAKENKHNQALAQQIDIAAQWALNATLLAAPAFVMAQNSNVLSFPILLAFIFWGIGFAIETFADSQKKAFMVQSAKDDRPYAICDIGLWQYCRHPNYFGEWLVWTALSAAAIAALIGGPGFRADLPALFLLGVLIYSSRYMYVGLTHLTGIEPSEHFSRIKRPDYAAYCRRVPAFWPWSKSQ